MRPPVLFLCALAFVGCRPDLGERDSLVTEERILAVRGEPPEARPGEAVSFSLLVASPGGTIPQPAASWAFCASPKLLSENDVVSRACVQDGVRPIESGASQASAKTPDDACSIFGPETPPGGLRPHDPDVTGGFYQPVRVELDGQMAFGLERVRCHLANASADVAQAFAMSYTPNKNPSLGDLVATVDGVSRPLTQLPTGKRIRFEISWSPTDAEDYVTFDIATQSLVPRRESMRVSWFATAGSFDADRTGRGEQESVSTTDNGWVAPATPGDIHMWIVLRDSRGGAVFRGYELTTAR